MTKHNEPRPPTSDDAPKPAAIVETIAVPGDPNSLVMNRAGTRLYVTSATTGSITVLGTQPLRVIQTLTGLGSPIRIVISPDDSRVYVSDNSVATGTPINVIETLNNTVVKTITGLITVNGMARNSTGTRLYVADHGDSKLVAFDTSTYQRVSETPVHGPKDVVIAPDNTRAHVATDSHGWAIVDLASNNVTAYIGIAAGPPTAIAYSPRYPNLYITHRESGKVTVGNALIPDVSKEISNLEGPWTIAFNRLSEMAYISETDGRRISIIDTRLNRITGTIEGFDKPRGMVVAPDGRNLYVADIENGSVSMVRL
ncbi:YncE family protein [Pseudomonas sp. RA_5y_Pfl1_P24]|uniref:YncE family protein n=1 Tax=Pseudomonas sp. RA_5y_Pfl1_P24 TaxID=3088706 RepID=UPI0030DCEA3A